jgi:hypothetical protein
VENESGHSVAKSEDISQSMDSDELRLNDEEEEENGSPSYYEGHTSLISSEKHKSISSFCVGAHS